MPGNAPSVRRDWRKKEQKAKAKHGTALPQSSGEPGIQDFCLVSGATGGQGSKEEKEGSKHLEKESAKFLAKEARPLKIGATVSTLTSSNFRCSRH